MLQSRYLNGLARPAHLAPTSDGHHEGLVLEASCTSQQTANNRGTLANQNVGDENLSARSFKPINYTSI